MRLLILVLLAVSAAGPSAAADRAARPNILFIHVDDLGWGDLSSYGQRRFVTPHLDRMAAEGIRFTSYYAGSAVCAPSRASLMTGRHTGHASVRGNGDVPLDPADVTVAEVLRAAGYRTGLVGKWGLGPEGSDATPAAQGFDESFGVLHHVHAHRQYTDHLYRNGRRVAVDPRRFTGDLYLEESLSFVRRHRARPWFLYLALTVPHAELRVPEDSMRPFRGTLGPETPYRSEKGDAAFPVRPPWQWREYRSQPEPHAAFAAMVTRLDRDVGRLLAELLRQGVDGRTIVFFTSDNGPHAEGGGDPAFFSSAGPFRGKKRDLYEGGIRVPMIVRWPGRVPGGLTSAVPWTHWDVLPTLAALAGAEPPGGLDGRSMMGALEGRADARGSETLYWEMHEPAFQQAVRMGWWKAVRHGANGAVELYDLERDPGERKDVAAANPAVVARARALFAAERTEPAWPAWRLDQQAPTSDRPRAPPPEGMVWIPGGTFTMGTTEPHFPDAHPPHPVTVDGFWMDATEVTNAQFRAFVETTGYVTVAERKPDAAAFPGASARDLVPGSVVFSPPRGDVPLDDPSRWWRWQRGASWRRPEGPGSSLAGRDRHPVVHVAWDDAVAYARWAGKRLPTEAEWERAARGGLEGKAFAWGDAESPAGRPMANVWQGAFPSENTARDGFTRTAPVRQFPPNGFGLYDVAGNVWEWIADWYRPDAWDARPRRNPRGPEASHDPAEPGVPKRVMRGGSFLCSERYCVRYKVAGRGKGAPDTGLSNLGFRCIMDRAR